MAAAVLLDRDYRSGVEKKHIEEALKDAIQFSTIHDCKEIENFLLVPEAIDRAVKTRLRDRKARTGEDAEDAESAEAILREFAEQRKHYIAGQYLGLRRQFEREQGSKLKDETILEEEHKAFDERWADPSERLKMIPGKEALSYINSIIQPKYNVTVTPTSIIEAMRADEVPVGMKQLILGLEAFSKQAPV